MLFNPPRTPWLLKRVRAHGHYNPGGGSFNLQIWDADRQVLYTHSYRYEEIFLSGADGAWADIELPELVITGDFYVVLAPNSQPDGPVLYLNSDRTAPVEGHSYFVDAETREIYEGPYSDQDWLMRAVGYPYVATPTPAPEELAYDDGTYESQWTAAQPYAAAVRFTTVDAGWWLTEVRIHGSYTGASGTFQLAVWDSDLKLLYEKTYNYDEYFARGVSSWASIPIEPQRVTGDFYVAVAPGYVEGLHGLYLSQDLTLPYAGRSYEGWIDTHDLVVGPYSDRDWMIRARGELRR